MAQAFRFHGGLSGGQIHYYPHSLSASFYRAPSLSPRRVLLVWSDERVALTQQAVTVWSRDEGLSGVQHAIFSDLPAAAGNAGGAASGPGIADFLKLQLLSAKVR